MQKDTVAQVAKNRAKFKRGKILIVDDEPSVRKMLRKIHEREDYACEIAGNADEAMNLLNIKSFDLVISDVVMPGKSGVQLLADIRAIHPRVPILMISGNTTDKRRNPPYSWGLMIFS